MTHQNSGFRSLRPCLIALAWSLVAWTAPIQGQFIAVTDASTVNQGAECTQRAKVAMAPGGSSVVVWTETGTSSIKARLYSAAGAPVGNAFTATTGDFPDVGMAADGTFVIAHRSATSALVTRRFDAAGAQLGSDLTVDATPSVLSVPQLAMADDGRFVSVWTTEVGGNETLRGQRFDAAGALVGSAFAVTGATAVGVVAADVAIEPDGDSFIIAWDEEVGGQIDVKARRWAIDGTEIGSEFVVNAYTAQNQSNPVVAMDAAGGFVVDWQGVLADSFDSDIVETRFASDGSRTDEGRIGNTARGESAAQVAVSNDGGGRLVAYNQNHPSPAVVKDLRFSIQNGNDFLLAGPMPNFVEPAVAFDDRERGVIAWADGTGGCATIQAQSLQSFRQLNAPGLSGTIHSLSQQGAWKYYLFVPNTSAADTTFTLELPAGAPQDADLYARIGDFPTLGDYTCRSFFGGGTTETCRVAATGQGVFIGVNGYDVGGIDFTLSVNEVAGIFYDGFEFGNTSQWTSATH